jgi:hypothetical protein
MTKSKLQLKKNRTNKGKKRNYINRKTIRPTQKGGGLLNRLRGLFKSKRKNETFKGVEFVTVLENKPHFHNLRSNQTNINLSNRFAQIKNRQNNNQNTENARLYNITDRQYMRYSEELDNILKNYDFYNQNEIESKTIYKKKVLDYFTNPQSFDNKDMKDPIIYSLIQQLNEKFNSRNGQGQYNDLYNKAVEWKHKKYLETNQKVLNNRNTNPLNVNNILNFCYILYNFERHGIKDINDVQLVKNTLEKLNNLSQERQTKNTDSEYDKLNIYITILLNDLENNNIKPNPILTYCTQPDIISCLKIFAQFYIDDPNIQATNKPTTKPAPPKPELPPLENQNEPVAKPAPPKSELPPPENQNEPVAKPIPPKPELPPLENKNEHVAKSKSNTMRRPSRARSLSGTRTRTRTQRLSERRSASYI